MTILVDHEILKEIELGNLVIDPFSKELMQPNSYDLRLADAFTTQANSSEPIDPYDRESVVNSHIQIKAENFLLQPGQFILAASLEKVFLPKGIVGQLTGKSSIGRLGVMVHVTAGFIDSGFSRPPAQLTLEIVNVGKRPVHLYAGMPLAQLILIRTAECTKAYYELETAKYNAQPAAAPSRYYLNQPILQEPEKDIS